MAIRKLNQGWERGDKANGGGGYGISRCHGWKVRLREGEGDWLGEESSLLPKGTLSCGPAGDPPGQQCPTQHGTSMSGANTFGEGISASRLYQSSLFRPLLTI